MSKIKDMLSQLIQADYLKTSRIGCLKMTHCMFLPHTVLGYKDLNYTYVMFDTCLCCLCLITQRSFFFSYFFLLLLFLFL